MILEQITEQLIETLKTRVLALFGHSVDRVILQPPPERGLPESQRRTPRAAVAEEPVSLPIVAPEPEATRAAG